YRFQRTEYITVKVLFHFSLKFPLGHIVLHQPVFQRVVAHHHQSSLGLQQISSLHQHFFQRPHLIIHRDPQSLENLGKIFELLAPWRQLVEYFLEFSNGIKRPVDSFRNHDLGQSLCILDLSVDTEDLMELCFRITSEDNLGRQGGGGIHSHVKLPIKPGGKPSIRNIYL